MVKVIRVEFSGFKIIIVVFVSGFCVLFVMLLWICIVVFCVKVMLLKEKKSVSMKNSWVIGFMKGDFLKIIKMD